MTTTSKPNSLIIIISLAIILFVSAFIWKKLHVDNSESITVVDAVEEVKPVKKTIKKPIVEQVFVEETNIIDSPSNEAHRPADYKEKRAALHRTLSMNLMLKTPEDVMEVIEKLQDLGRADEANPYIEYLLKTFPEYEMEK